LLSESKTANKRGSEMCDQYNQSIVDQVVQEKLGGSEMFTAFDITLEAKERGATERHRHMKRYIHDAIQREQGPYGYSRTLISLDGVKEQPWLYHPVGADVQTYPGLQDDPQPASSQPAVATAVMDEDEDEDEDEDGVFKVDRWNRLFIPKKILTQVGFASGDLMFVEADPNEERIVLHKHNPGTWACKYKLDWHPSARITPRRLRLAGLTGDKFLMEVDTGTRTVTIKQK